MATPRFTGPPGAPKQPKFKPLHTEQAKKSGPQPPIPTKKPATSKTPTAVKPGAPAAGMTGFGGDKADQKSEKAKAGKGVGGKK
jgi:hypothetical protein